MICQDATPLILSADLVASVAFFETVLGFVAQIKTEAYAILRRDGAVIRLYAESGGSVADAASQPMGFYVDIDDVDGLFAALAPALEATGTDHRPPFDQPYGQREFHVYHHQVQIIFGAPLPVGGG